MIGYLSGWAAAGFGVRVYQLAIMKRNIFESKQNSNATVGGLPSAGLGEG